LDAFFLPTPTGRRFCVFHPAAAPGGAREGALVFVHPFAEEMNKSRRMAALTACAFAQSGFDVLRMDLLGCGDSDGDSADATWDAWQRDIELAVTWLAARTEGRVWIWGLRLGALLAAVVASRASDPMHLLFWQPTTSGQRFIQQFLRTQVLADIISESGGRRSGSEMLTALSNGKFLEVAGYRLTPDLMLPIHRAELPPPPRGSIVRCIEIAQGMTDVSLSSQRVVAEWREMGVDAAASVVEGPPFWQTQEMSDCPSLIAASVSAVVDSTTLDRRSI
jgi:exosortase A-associated hydrolase 2